MGLRDATNMWEGEIIHKALGNAKSALAGIRKAFKKIEKHAGMTKRLVRDIAIEEGFQIKIKDTLAHNNQFYVKWYALADEDINKTR